MPGLRIFAWNLRHGGGTTRTPGIVLEILEQHADVVVLMEWRTRMGGQIAGVLADHGWRWQTHTEPEDGVNGVLVASKHELRRVHTHVDLPGSRARRGLALRWVEVELAATAIAAAHVPCDGPGRDAVLAAMVDMARRRRDQRGVILGDFNVAGREQRGVRPWGVGDGGELTLGRLASLGWIDACAAAPGSAEATWHGPALNSRDSSGFRLDQAWVSTRLAHRGAVSRAVHEGRLQGLSDHSGVVLDVADATAIDVDNEKPREKWAL